MVTVAKELEEEAKEAEEQDFVDDQSQTECELNNWLLPVAFCEDRHLQKIESSKTVTQTWRMKERMKTVSVALVLCLNVGVDPPDVVKTSPCARLECWIDPSSMSQQKALEAIGTGLQHQYERWQPRARYKQSLDPTVEEVKKLCTSLRRNAKEERVLFHYNGHGVPKPTTNGEIWVFNKVPKSETEVYGDSSAVQNYHYQTMSYTQYIPLSVYDLQTWMGSPSIYVYDCSNAAIIVESFKQFCVQREQEADVEERGNGSQRYGGVAGVTSTTPTVKNCIQLAACGANELLPMNPELPADLFTACLTTPIKIALRWFVLQNTGRLVPNITLELIDKIPGMLNDRRTMLGELNWIFTAITDTIAWNTLPRDLFQKLFRQDLLVASLFRNFLLAERIMRSYNCTPTSSPKLPPTYQHPMWQAWDLALDLCLSQLTGILQEEKSFQHSPFFAEQLTAFQVWLSHGCDRRSPPEQLPIVLQVLLSQVHRLRALDLLGRFLDLGPWAVSLALSVGIFPYVLKLLQSSARELRPLLVFIWAKILAVDSSCQADLVKDSGHKYFLSVLADPYMPPEQRTMAAFVLAMIVNGYHNGQEAALQDNLIAICLEQLEESHHALRQWLALCLGKVWTNFDAARWCGVRDSAHEKLYQLLSDPIPEVRAAAVYALGTFIGSCSERSDHANNIDHSVAMKLLNEVVNDGSPICRKELLVALAGLVVQFETQFASVVHHLLEEEKLDRVTFTSQTVSGGWSYISGPPGTMEQRRLDTRRASVSNASKVAPRVFLVPDTGMFAPGSSTGVLGMRRSASSRSLRGMLSPTTPPSNLLTIPASNSNDCLAANDSTPVKRVGSTTSLLGLSVGSYGNVYANVWKTLQHLAQDPSPDAAVMAQALVNRIKNKAMGSGQIRSASSHKHIPLSAAVSHSAPSSPSNKPPVNMHPAQQIREAAERTEGLGSSPRPNTLKPAEHASGRPLANTSTSSWSSRPRRLTDKPGNNEDEDEASCLHTLGVCTDFFNWCCCYFSQSVMSQPAGEDVESVAYQQKEYRFLRSSRVRQDALQEQRKAGFSRLDDQIFINRNAFVPTLVKFHPYESQLAVADKEGVSIWEWEQGVRLTYLQNSNPRHTRITSLDFVNAHDRALLMTGTDDGAVKVWRNYNSENGNALQLVTAWHALHDMLHSNKGAGLVLEWEQASKTLLASGDVRVIRIWDINREMRVQDLPTGADSCVTSLACDSAGKSLLVAGCGDGSVRLYDRRLPPADCRVMTLREHTGWVIKVHKQRWLEGNIISAGAGGDIRFWDPRSTESIRTINTPHGLTALEVHGHADVLACGSVQQFIGVFNQSGDNLSTIKYHEGFLGQRIGPISSLAFHPYKVKLAACSTDMFVSVYSSPENKRR